MKKLVLVSAAIAALTSSAFGADLGARPYTKAPPPLVSPVTNWSGFYIGAMGGYGWSDRITINGVGFSSNDLRGGFVGGTLGFNWQAPGSSFVWGIEADGAASDISARDGVFGLFAVEDKIEAFGSVTGRLGWAATPAALLYVKGGYAWADNHFSVAVPGVLLRDSQFHSGWTVGGGIEYMFVPNWSAKVEYMFADYGHKTFFNGPVFPGGLELGATTHTIKGGINYHFNWGGPVATAY